jgi:hypothetical protein
LDILNVIYALSFIPDHHEKSKIGNLINHVLSQWDGKHWLGSAKKIPEWKSFDFGYKNKGSDWIAGLILTSIMRSHLLE